MTLKIAHRGASGNEPENSLRAFRKAIELGADVIECDVRLSKDKKAIIIHDKKVRQTTNRKRRVVDLTLEELKTLDVGKGEKIPTLEEALAVVDRKAKMNIELKAEETAEPVAMIINEHVKEKGWNYEDFFLCSFNHKELKKFHFLLPQVKIGILVYRVPLSLLKLAKELHAYSINLSLKKLNTKRILQIRKENIKIFVWTVDEPQDIKKVKALGVDGIISNFPERI